MKTQDRPCSVSRGLFGGLCRGAVALATVVTFLGSVSVALAEDQVNPPEPQKPWFQWLFMLTFVIVCCAVAFKNPKRSHMS